MTAPRADGDRAAMFAPRPRPPRALFAALCLVVAAAVAAVAAGCSDSDTSDGPGTTSDSGGGGGGADTLVGGTGHVVLDVLAPPEAPELWPAPEGATLRVERLAEGAATVLSEGPTAAAPLRVEPSYARSTGFRLTLLDAGGAVLGRAVTTRVVMDNTDDDRLLPAFLLPDNTVVSVVDPTSAVVTIPGGLGAGATSLGGEVVVSGGAAYAGGAPCSKGAVGAPSDAVHIFDTRGHNVRNANPLAVPRSFHASVALSGTRVGLFGGYTAAGADAPTTASVEIVRTSDGVVESAPFGLQTARARHCAVKVGNNVIVAGGTGGAGASLELWSEGAGTLQSLALFERHEDPACVVRREPVLEQDRVFVAGGAGAPMPTLVEVVRVDGTNLIHDGTVSLSGGPLWLPGVGDMQRPIGLVLAGGFGAASGTAPRTNVVRFDDLTALFTTEVSLSTARGCPAAAAVGESLVVAGGMGASGEPVASVDVLQWPPGGGKAVSLPSVSMERARAGARAVALDVDAVLLVGGVAVQQGVASAADRLEWLRPGAP